MSAVNIPPVSRYGSLLRSNDDLCLQNINRPSGNLGKSTRLHHEQRHGCGSWFSTTASLERYAVVDHSDAYENAMRGRHGQQLALAKLEGVGKDDPPFDPFLEEEQLLQKPKKMEEELENSAPVKTGEEEKDPLSEDGDAHKTFVSEGEEDEDELESPYNPDGSLRRKKSVLATLRAGFPAGGMFAIVELAGSQHKVTTDDLIVVCRLKPVDIFKIGSVHTLTDVMLVGSSHLTMVGVPYVKGAEVDVMIEEITQDAKVIVFKKRRRKHSQRKNGFRRDLTMLRVLNIRLPEEFMEHSHVNRDSVDELVPDRTILQQAATSLVTPAVATSQANPAAGRNQAKASSLKLERSLVTTDAA